MEKELLLEIKEYIEKSESAFMWEYSSNIVENEVLFASNRMPELYKKINNLLTNPGESQKRR